MESNKIKVKIDSTELLFVEGPANFPQLTFEIDATNVNEDEIRKRLENCQVSTYFRVLTRICIHINLVQKHECSLLIPNVFQIKLC